MNLALPNPNKAVSRHWPSRWDRDGLDYDAILIFDVGRAIEQRTKHGCWSIPAELVLGARFGAERKDSSTPENRNPDLIPDRNVLQKSGAITTLDGRSLNSDDDVARA